MPQPQVKAHRSPGRTHLSQLGRSSPTQEASYGYAPTEFTLTALLFVKLQSTKVVFFSLFNRTAPPKPATTEPTTHHA